MKVADGLGAARHLAITPNGDIFVKLADLKNGKGIYWLHDDNKDGKMDKMIGFGNFKGTGMYISNHYLYASSDTEVFRYKLDDNYQPDTSSQEKIITGLLARGEHEAKAITLG